MSTAFRLFGERRRGNRLKPAPQTAALGAAFRLSAVRVQVSLDTARDPTHPAARFVSERPLYHMAKITILPANVSAEVSDGENLIEAGEAAGVKWRRDASTAPAAPAPPKW